MEKVAKYYLNDGDSYDAAVKRLCSEPGGNSNTWDCQ